MPNLVKKFKVEVGFLWGGVGVEKELKVTPRKIGLTLIPKTSMLFEHMNDVTINDRLF